MTAANKLQERGQPSADPHAISDLHYLATPCPVPIPSSRKILLKIVETTPAQVAATAAPNLVCTLHIC